MTAALTDVDPFDLPAWLGTGEVTWVSEAGIRGSFRVAGRLRGESAAQEHPCDLLGVDLAYPAPVVSDDVRTRAHQAWQHGQVLIAADGAGEGDGGGDGGGRLVLAVPGSGFTADLVIDALARLALAVGASPAQYAVHLQIGRERR